MLAEIDSQFHKAAFPIVILLGAISPLTLTIYLCNTALIDRFFGKGVLHLYIRHHCLVVDSCFRHFLLGYPAHRYIVLPYLGRLL